MAKFNIVGTIKCDLKRVFVRQGQKPLIETTYFYVEIALATISLVRNLFEVNFFFEICLKVRRGDETKFYFIFSTKKEKRKGSEKRGDYW